MLTNLKCHLQFLEIYLLCTLCHIACISVLTKPVFGLIERDGEWRMLNALFEGRILFLALLTHSRSRVIQNVRVIAVLQKCHQAVKGYYFIFFFTFQLKAQIHTQMAFNFFFFFYSANKPFLPPSTSTEALPSFIFHTSTVTYEMFKCT